MAPETERPEDDPELDRWLDGLAGKRASDERDHNAEIGRRLRARVLEQQREFAAELTPEEIQGDKERLLFAARSAASKAAGNRKPPFTLPAALAAGIAVLAVGGIVGRNYYDANYAAGLLASYGELEIARDTSPAQVATSPTPLRTARRLADALEEAGVPFELNRATDRTLTIAISPSTDAQLAALRGLFAEWGLMFDEPGYYVVVVAE